MDFWLLITLFIVADALILFLVLFLKKNKFSPAEKKKYLQYWQKLSGDRDLKRAIMEADKLLDLILTKKGYTGSLGEKLKKSSKLFSDNNAVWSAHKVRNRIAHEIDAYLSPQEAQLALRNFKQAFKDLGLF